MPTKKPLVILLALCLLFVFTGLAAAGFNDVAGHWAQEQINKWADQGLVAGYQDGSFKPNSQISRAEFVAMVNRSFDIDKGSTGSGFKDVQPGKWYYQDVIAAKANGYIGGYTDGTFKPDQTITRQEVASILVRLLQLTPTTQGLDGFKDANRIPGWARESVGAVAKAGLMRGMPDNTFGPLKNITRAEAVVSLDRALAFRTETPALQPDVDSAIEGIVTYKGNAADKAVVRIFKAGDSEVWQETKTNRDGYYKVELDAGDYDITAVTNSAVAYKTDVNVAPNTVTRTDLDLEDGAIVKGVLKDKNNRIIRNATLLFTSDVTFITSTNNSGEYTIVLPANMDYHVTSWDPDDKEPVPSTVARGLSIGAPGTHRGIDLEAGFAVSSGGGGGGGGGGAVTKYTLTLNGAGLTSVPEAGRIEKGTSVTVTVTPPAGQQIATFTVNGVDKQAELVDNQYTFTIKGNTTIAVTYAALAIDFDPLWVAFASTVNTQAQKTDPRDIVTVEFDAGNKQVNFKILESEQGYGLERLAGTGVKTAVINLLKSEKVTKVKSEGYEGNTLDDGIKRSDAALEVEAASIVNAWLGANNLEYLVGNTYPFILYGEINGNEIYEEYQIVFSSSIRPI